MTLENNGIIGDAHGAVDVHGDVVPRRHDATMLLLGGVPRRCDLRVSPVCGDQLHGRPAHEDLAVESLAPRKWRYVAVLVKCIRAVAGMQLFAQGGSYIRLRAVVEQELREGRRLLALLIVHPE